MKEIKKKAYIRLMSVVVCVFVLGIVAIICIKTNIFIDCFKGEDINAGLGKDWILEGNYRSVYKDNVAAMSSILVGIIGTIVILCYLVMFFPRAQVYTYSFENKRIKVGKITVLKNGDAFYGLINDEIFNRSETGKFEIRFSGEFIEKNQNSSIIIRMGKKVYCELIKPRIVIKERI